MRMPTERSVDNWFYILIKYVFNSLLAVIRVVIHVQRFILSIWRIIRHIVMMPTHVLAGIFIIIYRSGRYLLGGWLMRTIIILAVWTFILLEFIIVD